MSTFFLSIVYSSIALGDCKQIFENSSGQSNIHVKKLKVSSSAFTQREVLYALPEGDPPASGWPVVIFYQGSLFKSSFDWPKWSPMGGYFESETLKALVRSGFAVIVPRALLGIAWMTNSGLPYEKASDFYFIKKVLAGIENGEFGAINSKQKFAAGMSSGGYNTSRMAVSFPDEFLGLAIHSASYATCIGGIKCKVPDDLPTSHPPTLFIHGRNDKIVPLASMLPYAQKLQDAGFSTEVHIDESGGHEYFPETPELIVNWFRSLLHVHFDK